MSVNIIERDCSGEDKKNSGARTTFYTTTTSSVARPLLSPSKTIPAADSFQQRWRPGWQDRAVLEFLWILRVNPVGAFSVLSGWFAGGTLIHLLLHSESSYMLDATFVKDFSFFHPALTSSPSPSRRMYSRMSLKVRTPTSRPSSLMTTKR